MQYRILLITLALVTVVSSGLRAAEAGIVLKIRAVNPLNIETTEPIKYYLPKGVKPEDIINKGDLLIMLDGTNGLYYLEKQMVLKPKEVVTLEVEIRDIWIISRDTIDGLMLEVNRLTRKPLSNLISELKQGIIKNLNSVVYNQEQNTVAMAGGERHIQAYEDNIQVLKQAEIDLDALKNLINQAKK